MVQSKNRNTRSDEIAAACLTHLQAEEAVLDQLEAIVDRSHQALVERNISELFETGEQLHTQRGASLEIAERRQILRRELGIWLGVLPEQVTMSQVSKHLDGSFRSQYATIQRRLRERVLRLSHILQNNAMIAAQQDLVIRQTMATLTGQTEQERYGASGQLQPGQSPSIFEADL